MSKDIDSIDRLRAKSKDKNTSTDQFILEIYPNTINQLDQNETELEQLIRQKKYMIRQDVKIYKFSFVSCSQAVAIILAITMTLNILLYLIYYSGTNPNWTTTYSWVIFLESGFLILASGFTVHRRQLVVKKRRYSKTNSSKIDSLKFAFVHSLTYFMAGLLMLGLSAIIANTLY